MYLRNTPQSRRRLQRAQERKGLLHVPSLPPATHILHILFEPGDHWKIKGFTRPYFVEDPAPAIHVVEAAADLGNGRGPCLPDLDQNLVGQPLHHRGMLDPGVGLQAARNAIRIETKLSSG